MLRYVLETTHKLVSEELPCLNGSPGYVTPRVKLPSSWNSSMVKLTFSTPLLSVIATPAELSADHV